MPSFKGDVVNRDLVDVFQTLITDLHLRRRLHVDPAISTISKVFFDSTADFQRGTDIQNISFSLCSVLSMHFPVKIDIRFSVYFL